MKQFIDFLKKYSDEALISLAGVLAPIKPLILSTGFLIVADAVVGIYAAKKRGETITSAGFRRTVTKMFTYQLAIICGYFIEVYMMEGVFPISKVVAAAISLVEFKSLLESVNEINGNKVFVGVIKKLGSINDITSESSDQSQDPKVEPESKQ
jgi:hypothetical protein